MDILWIVLLVLPLLVSSSVPNAKVGHVKNSIRNIIQLVSGKYKENAEELSGQFEGDIILNNQQANSLSDTALTRNGLIDQRYHWKNAIVPYSLDNVFSDAQKAYIEKALRTIESVTCVRFVPRTNQYDYIYVTGNPDGCYATVGRQGGRQTLNLVRATPGTGCLRIGTIMHEFLHGLGFYHMQSATERDQFVDIAWDHVQRGKEHNFNKYPANRITNFNIEYDVSSVLHYGAYAFSSDGKPTIVPRNIAVINTLGQRTRLSPNDIRRINAMYC